MKGVLVDPAKRTVRALGGVTWGEFNRKTQVYGLATVTAGPCQKLKLPCGLPETSEVPSWMLWAQCLTLK